MKTNDGGPAFPMPNVKVYRDDNIIGSAGPIEYGMTLRDWFAGIALQGMAHELIKNGYPKKECFIDGYPEGELIAATAFMLADVMLREREHGR